MNEGPVNSKIRESFIHFFGLFAYYIKDRYFKG